LLRGEKTALGKLAAVRDNHGLRSPSVAAANALNLLDDIHATSDGTEHAVLAIQPGGGYSAQEELGAVGVGPSVCHREDSRASVLQGEVLVLELGAVDALTAGTVARGEITTLAHEVLDHTVEGAALEVEGLAGLADTLLACAKAPEVLGSVGDDVSTKSHLNATRGRPTNGNVEEDNWVSHF